MIVTTKVVNIVNIVKTKDVQRYTPAYCKRVFLVFFTFAIPAAFDNTFTFLPTFASIPICNEKPD